VKPVDWTAYAREYDLMARHNPAYQQLLAHCAESVTAWNLKPGEIIADFGAGTGNFSIALAKALPGIQVLHVENDEGMLRVAQLKAQTAGIPHWRAVSLDLQRNSWELPQLAGVVTVHCIYAISNPCQFIQRLCAQLRPGGHVYACDFGRQMNVRDWAGYLVAQSLRANGFWRTARLFAQCGQVRRQNRQVAECQRYGTYWTHDLAEFRAAFEAAGIEILTASNSLYRGYDDLIIGRKREER
jgi:ubiquinone/menaquinone biosynthesis C-methylase UbiE